MYDIIIENGTIIDGTGQERFSADIGISKDRIQSIGGLSEAPAKQRIDATGLIVAPGFVDIHTHSDFSLMVNGKAESQIHQGVTLEVVGNCGHSCAPCPKCDALKGIIFGYTESTPITWNSFAEYLSALDDQQLGVNVAALVGHGTLRVGAMEGDNINRYSTPSEVKEMDKLLHESLEAGAIGFSTGLEYAPGSSASTVEITQLCKTVGKYDRLYATHLRNRDIYFEQGFGEAIGVARAADVKLQISHITPKFGSPEGAMSQALEMIHWNQKRGVDIAFDIIPHNWGPTTMSSILPPWVFEGGVATILERLAQPALRPKIKHNPNPIWQLIPAGRWDMIILFQSINNVASCGLTIEEIARRRNRDAHDVVLDILLEEGEGLFNVTWAAKNFSEADNRLCIAQPECGVISDTITLAPYGELADTRWSPSTYGWTTRFIEEYTRTAPLISLEDAVHRLTGLAVDRIGVTDRGTIQTGQYADITIFHSEQLHDNTSLQDPNVYPDGIHYVLVNGKLAIEQGKRTPHNSGRVIRG